MEKTQEPPAQGKSETPQAKEDQYVFPPAHQGPVGHFDRATNTFWIGIRLDCMSWEATKLCLDHFLFTMYGIWAQLQEQMKANAQILGGVKKNGGLKGLFGIKP